MQTQVYYHYEDIELDEEAQQLVSQRANEAHEAALLRNQPPSSPFLAYDQIQTS